MFIIDDRRSIRKNYTYYYEVIVQISLIIDSEEVT